MDRAPASEFRLARAKSSSTPISTFDWSRSTADSRECSGDLHFEFDGDPDRLGVIHLYVDAEIVVTARLHPLKVVDQLRVELRHGMAVASTLRLVVHFIEDFADILANGYRRAR